MGSNPVPWYTCPNTDCRCADGGDTMYGKSKPLTHIESKRKQAERKRLRGATDGEQDGS